MRLTQRVRDFIGLNQLRGLSSRTCRLLDLEAIYEGTQYEGLEPWDSDAMVQGPSGPRPLCWDEKNPTVKAGMVREKIDTVVRMVGFPSNIEIGGEAGEAGVDLVKRILTEGRLKVQARKPTRDLPIKGSGALAFSVLADKRIEIHKLGPEWVDAILVCKAGTERAKSIAAEMGRLNEEDPHLQETGERIRLDEPRDEYEYLWTPDGALSHDVCWVRYEYATHQEARESAGVGKDDVYRVRVDYTPWQTVTYEPTRVGAGDTRTPGAWKVARVEDHDYGFVPVAWSRTPDAEDGDVDGPSLISEQLLTIARAADYTLTRKDESVGVIQSPKLLLIDAEDPTTNYNAERGLPTGYRATSKEGISIYSVSGKQASAMILETTGAGPKAGADHLDGLNAQAFKVTGIISFDPQQAAQVQSGTALERMMGPTIDVADWLRVSLGELLEQLVSKIARAFGVGGDHPEVVLTWPPFVEKTSADRQAEATAITTALNAGAISQATTAKLMAAVFGIEDADAEAEAVVGDAENDVARVRAQLEREGAAAPAPAKAGDQAPVEDVQKLALNGAQVTALADLLDRVARGQLPRATAKQVLIAAFQIDDAGAEAMLGPLDGFEPAPETGTTTKVVQPPPVPGDSK